LASSLGLDGIDLRGLRPSDLNDILSGTLNLRNITSREATDYSTIKQRMDEAILENQAKTAAARAVASKVTYGTPYEKDGKMYRDKLQGGSVIGTEDLGEKKTSYKPNVFVRDDGTPVEVPVGTEIPAGLKVPSEVQVNLTGEQQRQQEQDLAGIEQMLLTGVDSKGNEIENLEALQGWADTYNKRNSNYNVVMVPKKEGEPIPFTFGFFTKGGAPAKYIKVPKTRITAPKAALDALKSNPDKVEDFVKKYHYLPEGY